MQELDVSAMLGFGLVLLGAGLLAGFLGGLIGAGGGLIVVPVLYHTFESLGVDPAVRMHMAIGTALAAVVPTALLGARAHWLRGNVSLAIFGKLALPVLVGSIFTGAIAGSVKSKGLSLVFALAAIFIALNLARRRGLDLRNGLPGPVGCGLLGVSIGSISTLVGIGGATLAVPVLHAFRTPMPIAVGTSATLGALVGLPGAIAFGVSGWNAPSLPPGSAGYVNLAAAAILFPSSAVAISVGARFTQQVNERLLRALFALLLALTALRMMLSLF